MYVVQHTVQCTLYRTYMFSRRRFCKIRYFKISTCIILHQNLEISIRIGFTVNASISDPDPNSGILLDSDPVFAESVLKPSLDVD